MTDTMITAAVTAFREHLYARCKEKIFNHRPAAGLSDDDGSAVGSWDCGVQGNEMRMNDREFGSACAEWFLADANNVARFQEEIDARGVSAAQVFSLDATWYLFQTMFSDHQCDSETVLHVFSLFGRGGDVVRMSFPYCGHQLPMQVWLLFKSIHYTRLDLAYVFVFGCANHYGIKPLTAVPEAAPPCDYSWVGMLWIEHRQFLALLQTSTATASPRSRLPLEPDFWKTALGLGMETQFAQQLTFVANVLRRTLPEGTITAAEIFPLETYGKLSTTDCLAQVHMRRCFDEMFSKDAHRVFYASEFASVLYERALCSPLFSYFLRTSPRVVCNLH